VGGEASLDEQRRRSAEALRPIAAEAHRRGVTLAIEPLNRFETDLLNTVEQGVAWVADVAHPACGLLLDTFHMHIEEKDSARAIGRAAKADMLVHVHASENDRGVAGSGQVNWSAVARALLDVRYDGWVVLESFNQDNRAIRTAVSCWRPFYASQREFLEAGLRYVTELLDLRIA
jgi:D-psicose/D-tagatose/L-ribulose 3-epimerase